jgi:HemY protein
MLWSLLKIVVFLAVAAALAWGFGHLIEADGRVTIALGAREFALTPIGFILALMALVIAALVLLQVVGFIVALIRFVLGDETAFTRFFSRHRERRGLDALTGSMLALASGDAQVATRKAARADRLLARPELTRLVSVRAAEASGDDAKALTLYKAMLEDDRTRFVAVEGLMRQKLAAGETDTALALAKKAFEIRPDNDKVLNTLFDLQSRTGDWAGARETLNAKVHARILPKDVGKRRDAILSLADARKALAAAEAAGAEADRAALRGEPGLAESEKARAAREALRGRDAAKEAGKLAPTLVPAAVVAAETHLEEGSKRKAAKALTTAWASVQHPDLAAAFASIEPGETASARRKRFAALIAAAPSSPESRLLDAELALADEDFPAARKALGDLAETQPTARSLAIMAALEKGQGGSEQVVRGWLAKALVAPRGPQWICGKCNHVHAAWTPICESCGAFDTLDWRAPAHAEDGGLGQSAMLPLILGGAEKTAPATEMEGAGIIVEEGVIATEADEARTAETARV